MAEGQDVLVLAHRGYHAFERENTMAAFQAAVNEGVDGIETDVRRSLDGKAVLIHDRHTPQGDDVTSLTHAQLCTALGHAVPTLDEALNAFPNLLWNVELKNAGGLAAAMACLQSLPASRAIVITSFWHNMVQQASELFTIRCGLLMASRPLNAHPGPQNWLPRPGRIDTIVWGYDILDASLLEQARDNGYRNWVYSPQDQAEHDACVRAPVEAVITDWPGKLRR